MSQASFTILWGLTMKYSTEAHSCIYASSHQGAEAENTEHFQTNLLIQQYM